MKVDRRKFLKTSAMAAATAAAVSKVSGQAVKPVLADNSPLKWDKAPCRFCGTGCHVQVGVRNGKVEAIAGDPHADVNKGLLCVKGYNVGGILYGKDRIKHPMLRVNGELKKISWDEAVEVIAKRIRKNPKGFAYYGSGQWTVPEGYIAQKFIKGGLSNNHIDPNARLCMASAVTGYISTFGVDEPPSCYDDFDYCDTLLIWGNNPAEMHPVLFSRVIDRRSRGEKVRIIDMGTRRTRTTDFADDYLQFNPQGDLAIVNGIAHLLIENGTFDAEFVEKHCNFRGDTQPFSLFGKEMSFEDYKASVKKYTPEYVEEISGIPAEKIRMLGDLFADKSNRICSIWCMGVNQHTRGTALNRMINGVHMLSGHFGKRGDGPQSLTGQPAACGTCREVGTLAHALPGGRIVANGDHRAATENFWNLPAGTINPTPGYHTVKMWEQFCTPTSEGGDVDTIWVQVTNPGQSLPNLKKHFQAKKGLKDKFLIVADVYPTVSTQLADLVLPAALWVEKNGIFGNSERRTQQWFKMVDPPGEARDDCWMMIAVARKLYEMDETAMRDKDGNFLFTVKDDNGKEVPVWNWENYYDVNVDRAMYEEYRPFTHMKKKNVAPYDVLVKERGMRWPVVQKEDGNWRETKWRFAEFDDPFVEKGKGQQFYNSVTKDDKALIWFAPYEPAAEEPDAEYPFWLSTGRVLEHWHTGTMTMRVPQLRRAMPHAYVEMSPADAEKLGLRSGNMVIVESRRAKLKLPVWIKGRSTVADGSVFIPFFDENLLANDLTLGEIDPISKEPDYKKCAVKVYPA
ncbi:MAG: molybdopterin-dependent oxidoreductase [Puniceicoccaceae bacterium]